MRTRPSTALRHHGGHPSSMEDQWRCWSTAALKKTSRASRNWSMQSCGTPRRRTCPARTQYAPRTAWSLYISRETL